MASPFPILSLVASVLLASGGPSVSGKEIAPADTQMEDAQGRAVKPFQDPDAKLVAFIFARSDCPISNAYAPEVRRLCAAFAPRGVKFWLVYPGADESREVIHRHLQDFDYPCGALRDPSHTFVKRSRVRVTPEAAVYGKDGTLLFHGRIDDRYAELGVKRPAPTVRDLQTALEDLLAGKSAKAPAGPAVGCIIEGGE